MQTKPFTFRVRSVRNGTARLVSYYDKDYDQRPAAVFIRTDAFKVGDEVRMSFIHSAADRREIMGAELV